MQKPVFLYGTTNPAKVTHMRNMLSTLPLTIVSIQEIGATVPDVEETGGSPLENARLKALSYYQVLQQPVFACNSGLWIKGLPEAEQPGVHVRTVNGKRLTDDEMVTHYAAIAERMGGKTVARYQNAICLVGAGGERYEHCGSDIAGRPFFLVSVPHAAHTPGFPLDCLSVRIDSGQYDCGCTRPQTGAESQTAGFIAFFQKILMRI